MEFKKWAAFGRWHTAALTSTYLVLGYLLAGSSLLSWRALAWALFGLLFHTAGFQNNNVMDLWADLGDGHKSHMPLVAGEMPLRDAVQVNAVLLLLTGFFGVLLTGFRPVAVVLLIVCCLSGFHYNYYCKRTVLAVASITLCFGLLPGVSYFSLADGSLMIGFVLAYCLAQIHWQIGWSGFIKDLLVDKVNLLRNLGCRVSGGWFVPSKGAQVYGWGSRLLLVVLGCWIWALSGSGALALLLLVVLVTTSVFSSHELINYREFTHMEIVRFCALTEILTLWVLLFALQGIIGWAAVVALVAVPLMWFVSWNYIYWGRLIAPNV